MMVHSPPGAASHPPRLERFAGRYLLLKKLGQGGAGEVHLARDLSTGAECALKRLRRATEDTGELLLREFEALARLRHPAVVRVHEYGKAPDGTPYLVMEYVPGLPADQVVSSGDWPALYALAARIAVGLEALHAVGVVHGDLKPSNILVVPPATGTLPIDVRLVDFGLAALRERNDAGYRGTPGFAAPEVVRGTAPTPAADLYGLGANLFALITGRAPLDGDNLPNTAHPRAHELETTGAPWPLIELILRLLHPEPGERPRDAGEVRRTIERLHPPVRQPLFDRLLATTLVGRERELAGIEAWLSRVPIRSRLLLIAGEEGSGVSALLVELAARATLARRPVVRLSCASLEGPGSAARVLLRMLYGLAEPRLDAASFGPLLDPASRCGETELGAWVAAAAQAAQMAQQSESAPSPMLIVLDDAGQLDSWSAAWIRRLILHDPPLPLMWAIARRHPGPHESFRVLIESGIAQQLELGPLDEASVHRLAATRLGGEPPQLVVRHLWQHAAGHPAMTVDVLRTLVERGVIVESDHGIIARPELLAELAPPGTLERARLDRLATLSTVERAIVSALAVCGPSLLRSDLARVVPAADDAAIERLIVSGFALLDGDARVLLHPPLLAEHVTGTLDPPTQEALHRAALTLESQTPRGRFHHHRALGEHTQALSEAAAEFAARPDAELAVLAAITANALGDEAVEAIWHARAAEEFRGHGQYAAAIPGLERALSLETDPARRGELWFLLSTATFRAGAIDGTIAAVGRSLGEPLTDTVRARLLCNRAAAHCAQSNKIAAADDARSALALASHARDDLAIGMAADIEVRLAMTTGRLADADRWTKRAATAFLRANYRPGVIRAVGNRASVARSRGALAEAERWCAEAVEAARTCVNRLPLCEQLTHQGAVSFEIGNWPQAHAALTEAVRISLEDGRSVEAAVATTHIAHLEGLMGETRAARRNGLRAVRMIARHQPTLASYAWRSLAQAERSAGRLGRASFAARRALNLSGKGSTAESRWCRIEYGRTLATSGRWSEAAVVWNAGLARAGRSRGLDVALLHVLGGRAALRESDLNVAARLRSDAATWLSRHPSPLVEAHASLLDAELAFRRGNVRTIAGAMPVTPTCLGIGSRSSPVKPSKLTDPQD